MTEQEIRTEYMRLFEVAHDTERLARLNGLHTQAHDAGLANWEQLIEARIATGEGNYTRAIDLSTRLIEDPQTTEDVKCWARLNRAVAYGGKGDPDKAIADYSAVIDDPNAPPEQRAMARVNRGLAYGKKGDADKAIADYSAVIDDPNAPPEQRAKARVNRGVAYGRKGDADKAIADYSAVIDDPNAPLEQRAMARVNRGVSYRQKGDVDKAIADYSTVIDDPNAPAEQRAKARANRGEAYRWKGETSAAKADFTGALAEPDTSPRFRDALLAYVNLLSQGTEDADTAAQAVMELKLDAKTRADFDAELDKEKKRKRDFFGATRFAPTVSFLLVGREWNSFTPAVPGLNEPSRGGGYFIRHNKTGIVVDPGFDFLEIFAKSGGTLRDIDHIVITHAHNDHTAEFETLLTLLREFNHRPRNEPAHQKMACVYLSQGAARKFAGLLQLRDCKYIREVVTLNRGRKDNPQVVRLSDDVSLTVLPAYHDDVITEDYAVGLGFEFRFGEEIRRVVLTGDTALFPTAGKDRDQPQRAVYQGYPEPFCPPRNAMLRSQAVQHRLLGRPGLSHVAAHQEDGQRQTAQEVADALAGLYFGCHFSAPGLQKLNGFIHRQRRQVTEIGRGITTTSCGY